MYIYIFTGLYIIYIGPAISDKVKNITFHACLEAVVIRHIWHQVGQEPLTGGDIVAEAGTTSCDSRMVGNN